MAQHSNEHLTITELSAYLDKELPPDEAALCAAHIQSCQPCQAALADLRLTSELLSSMPQVAVPRSFVLPTNLVILPETPDTVTGKTPEHSSSLAPLIWKRSMRALSTLVAILGLFFFLAGAFSALPHGGGMTASSTSNSSSGSAPRALSSQIVPAPTSTDFVTHSPQHLSPDVRATARSASQATTTAASTQPTANNTPPQDQPSAPPPELPAALDPGQPAGRLAIGGTLLFLGILGVIVTHLLDRPARR